MSGRVSHGSPYSEQHFARRNARLLDLRASHSPAPAQGSSAQLHSTQSQETQQNLGPNSQSSNLMLPHSFSICVTQAEVLWCEYLGTSSPDAVLWQVTKLPTICQESDVSFGLNLSLM